MSKSKGNILDPLEIVEKYGLDPEESIVSEDEFYETQNDIICTVRDNVTDRVKALL